MPVPPVLQRNGITSEGAPVVGFCFSFAVEQQALDSGKLLCWTKGFDVEGVIGKDVVQLMSGQHEGYSCSCHSCLCETVAEQAVFSGPGSRSVFCQAFAVCHVSCCLEAPCKFAGVGMIIVSQCPHVFVILQRLLSVLASPAVCWR